MRRARWRRRAAGHDATDKASRGDSIGTEVTVTTFGGGEGLESGENKIVSGLMAFGFFRKGRAERAETDGKPGSGPTRSTVLPEMMGMPKSSREIGFATPLQAEEG